MKKINWEKLLKDRRVVTIIVVLFVMLVGGLIYQAEHNRVLTKENLSYHIEGKNGNGELYLNDDSGFKIAKAVSQQVGKKVGLSKSQQDVVDDSESGDDILDGDTATQAYTMGNGNSKYHAFSTAIRQVKLETYINKRLARVDQAGQEELGPAIKRYYQLRNGDKVTLKLSSDSDDYRIKSEKYVIHVKGLKNPPKYKAKQALSHITYTFTGFNGTKLVSVKAKPDAWYSKHIGRDVPKPKAPGAKNGQQLSIKTRKWAARNSGNIKIIPSDDVRVKVTGLTDLASSGYQDLLTKMSQETVKRQGDNVSSLPNPNSDDDSGDSDDPVDTSDSDDNDQQTATLYKAYLEKFNGNYEITAFFKTSGHQYQQAQLDNIKLKNGTLHGHRKDIIVTDSSRSDANDYGKENHAILLPNN